MRGRPRAITWVCGTVILTEEQVNTAKTNGLTYHTVWARICRLKKSVERAINEPLDLKRSNKKGVVK
jgi:hypothetical protein